MHLGETVAQFYTWIEMFRFSSEQGIDNNQTFSHHDFGATLNCVTPVKLANVFHLSDRHSLDLHEPPVMAGFKGAESLGDSYYCMDIGDVEPVRVG